MYMSDQREELIENVKRWINLDEEIKTMQRQIKEKRNLKKELTSSLVKTMKSHDVDCFDINEGKLIYAKKKIRTPLSKKHLLKSLATFFEQDHQMVNKLGMYIMESRETKIKEEIRRKKYNK